MRSADLVLHAGDLSTAAVLEELRALGPPVAAVHGNIDSADAAAAAARAPGRGRGRGADRAGPRRRAGPRPPAAHAHGLPRMRRGRVRPLAHPAARGGGRLPDLQPGQPDRPPPPAAPQHGHGARATRGPSTSGSTFEALSGSTARRSEPCGRAQYARGPRRHVHRHRRLGSDRAARPAVHARAARRRPAAVRLRRGHAAPAPALDRPAGPRGDLPDPFPRRPLPRAAGDAEDVRPARARGAAHDLRPARAPRRCSSCCGRSSAARAYEVKLVELEPNEPLERDGYLVAPFPVEHRDSARLRLRPHRAGPAGPLRRGAGARARGRGGPGLRPPPAR